MSNTPNPTSHGYTKSELIDGLKHPEASQSDFAKSLLAQYAAKGTLSDKQWYWVHKLGVEQVSNPTPEPETVSVGQTFQGVLDLFAKARARIGWPAILLKSEDGLGIKLSPAPQHGKNPGSIYVKRSSDNAYLGKVSEDATYTPSPSAPANNASIIALLTALATDPAGLARKYGKLTGRCCFCGVPFTNDKSIALGYGPSCAKNYGLPYTQAAYQAALADLPVPVGPTVPAPAYTPSPEVLALRQQVADDTARQMYEQRPSRTMDLLSSAGLL